MIVGAGTGRISDEPCTPAVVVPRYEAGARTSLTPRSDTKAYFSLAPNAVNLMSQGAVGTAALGTLAARCTCTGGTMSDLDAPCDLVLSVLEQHHRAATVAEAV